MKEILTVAVRLQVVLVLNHCAAEPDRAAPHTSPARSASDPLTAPSVAQDAPRPRRHKMTTTEQSAIEEAQSRRATPPSTKAVRSETNTAEDAMGSTVIGRTKGAPKRPGLTQFERRAAMDDPAMNLPSNSSEQPRDLATDTAEPVASSKRATTSPRPGVELRSAVDGLKLVDLAIATDVKRREPTGIDDRFATLPKRFHCFCVFENRQQATQVTHVWKRNGRVVSRVELEVGKSPKWRTWSRQRLQPTWTGSWTCEVQSASGRTLGTASVQAGD
jgi:hypothetical protein